MRGWTRLLLMGACVLLAVSAWAAGQLVTFEKDRVGALPPAWTQFTGTWQVVADSSAPPHARALAQVSSNHSGTYFNVAVLNGVVAQNAAVTVHMRPVAGREDQGGGLVWRFRDIDNYYVARWNPLEDNFRAYKVVSGRRIQIGSADVHLKAGWHVLKAEMQGAHIECWLDGKKELDVEDSTFTEVGKVGLWTKSDAQTHFDHLVVEKH